MVDQRPYCVECEKRMVCKKNGVKIPYCEGMEQSGDMYECPICGAKIVMGFGEPYMVRGD